MSKRSFDSDSQSSQERGHKKCNNASKTGESVNIVIDHTNQQEFKIHQKLLQNKSLTDNTTDIKFIVDNVEISAHKEVIDILKDKRQLVRDAIERDKRLAEQENSEVANVFQMSGTTVNAFRNLLEYVYTGKVNCDLTTSIELATTAHKLKFHPLVATLAQHLALHKNYCLNLNTIDDLYHISKCANNKDLMKGCGKYMEEKAYDLNSLFLKRDTRPIDPSNVLIYAFDKSRYSNYIHFLVPQNTEICFNVSVSTDRTNWSVVLRNDEIWSKFWNWVYFEEKRIKFIRIIFTEQKGGNRFDVRTIRDDHFLCKRANVELEFDRETNYLIPKHDIIKFPVRETKYYFDDIQNLYTYCMSVASVSHKEKFWYYHLIGDGRSLEFYLSQTCLIDKFRLRLWDLDDRTYDFKVEVKTEEEDDFSLIKENKNSDHFIGKSSWQTIELRGRRAVRWIRITGTKGPKHDPEFAIIDFECPAQTHQRIK